MQSLLHEGTELHDPRVQVFVDLLHVLQRQILLRQVLGQTVHDLLQLGELHFQMALAA